MWWVYLIKLRTGSHVEISSRESHCLCVCVCVCVCARARAHYVQGDLGGKVNILGCDSIAHCEEIIPYKRVSNSE